MKIAKPWKIVLAVLSILPIFYMFFIFAFIAFTMGTTFSGKPPDKSTFDFFPVVFIMHFGVMLLCFALLAFYIFYLFKSDRVPQDKKALWAVVLFLGSFLAMPIFWYLYVWREPSITPAGE